MDIARQVSAVMLVFALLGAALWTLRRGGRLRLPGGMRPAGRGRALESVERLALGPQHSLHLVRLAGRALLVGTSPTGCAVLESFEWASVESARTPEVR